MLLSQLLPGQNIGTNDDRNIFAIELDSRNVRSSGIFFALKGKHFDGVKFIPEAINKGAVAVVCHFDAQFDLPANSKTFVVRVSDVYTTLVNALKRFYPHLPTNILVVTGTNGKTSVAEYMRQMQEMLGFKSASIGTLGVKINDYQISQKLSIPSLTTPDVISLYKNLAILKENGVNDVAIEASSIGIEQGRLAGINIAVGAFTNFTQDHLDYHHSMDEYFNAKMMLYSKVLRRNGIAILNADIPEFRTIKAIAEQGQHQVFSYGKEGRDAILVDSKVSDGEQSFVLKIFGHEYQAKVAILGEFQLMNILCALLAVACYYKLDQDKIGFLIAKFPLIIAADGRMERIKRLNNNAQIFLDYAHTPDALQNVLQNALKIPHHQIHVLFGCGGNRDGKKRPIMGQIASSLADLVIVTDDNPRNEDPKTIRQEILFGCNLDKTIEIGDRRQAIAYAVSRLAADDILIIAGKGHEKYQIIADQKIPFDEAEIVSQCLSPEK